MATKKDIRIHVKILHKVEGKNITVHTDPREVAVMAISGRYAMVRRKNAVPYVCLVSELEEKV